MLGKEVIMGRAEVHAEMKEMLKPVRGSWSLVGASA